MPSTTDTSALWPTGSSPSSGLSGRDEVDAGTRANAIVDRAAQGAHETIDSLAERAKPQVQRAQEGIDRGAQLLQRGADQARELADEWTTGLRVTIRQHPLGAVATALLFGLLLGRVTR
jgi:ElaB/YqjD/DUF883 family membrane-anchored ribosome-binding protein